MTVSSDVDLAGLTHIGRRVGLAVKEMRAAARPGATTVDVDAVGAAFLRRHGAQSAPQLTSGYPAFTCISVNEEVSTASRARACSGRATW